MGKLTLFRLTEIALLFLCLLYEPFELNAQKLATRSGSRIPWACRFLAPDYSVEKDDPEEEHSYAESSNKFYHLWCTSISSSKLDRETAANDMVGLWKKLWYRDEPFNVAFHETGSFDILVLLGITHKVPKPLTADPEFMHEWLKDCSDRCFMIYGDDDPSAKQEWQRMMHLRHDVLIHLKREPAAEPVFTMLKNAELYPVN